MACQPGEACCGKCKRTKRDGGHLEYFQNKAEASVSYVVLYELQGTIAKYLKNKPEPILDAPESALNIFST